MKIGQKLRELREKKGMLLREVAANLEIDTAMISKIERDEKNLKREHLKRLSELFNYSEKELMTLWLSDKLLEVVENEKHGLDALKLTEKRIKGI